MRKIYAAEAPVALGIDRDQYADHLVDVPAERTPPGKQLRSRVSHLRVPEVRGVGEEGMVASASMREAERRVEPAECGDPPAGDPLKDGCDQGM